MFSLPSRSSSPGSDGPLTLRSGADPTFCRRCRLEGFPEEGLCRNCGDTLVACGYCFTCEAFWKHAIGAACPKHDLPLEIAPPPLEPLGTPGQPAERWVTVATYGHPNEANAPRIRLEAEGIATFLDGARVAGSTLYQVATGGVRLQVPESLASSARVILAQTWATELDPRASDDPDDDDLWAGLAPDPGTRRRSVMKVAILLFLFGPGLITACNVLARWFGFTR